MVYQNCHSKIFSISLTSFYTLAFLLYLDKSILRHTSPLRKSLSMAYYYNGYQIWCMEI